MKGLYCATHLINEANKVNDGSSVVINATMSVSFTLTYKRGEKLTPEQLADHVHQGASWYVGKLSIEDLIDGVEIIEIRNKEY